MLDAADWSGSNSSQPLYCCEKGLVTHWPRGQVDTVLKLNIPPSLSGIEPWLSNSWPDSILNELCLMVRVEIKVMMGCTRRVNVWEGIFMARCLIKHMEILNGTVVPLNSKQAQRGGWSVPCPNCFTPGKRDPVPIVQEAWWALGLVRMNPGNLVPPVFEPHTLQPAASRNTNCTTSAYGNLPLHNWKVQKRWEEVRSTSQPRSMVSCGFNCVQCTIYTIRKALSVPQTSRQPPTKLHSVIMQDTI